MSPFSAVHSSYLTSVTYIYNSRTVGTAGQGGEEEEKEEEEEEFQ